MKKIAFINTAHPPLDDRTFYHQAVSLSARGYGVFIISSKQEMVGRRGSIMIDSFDDTRLSQREKVKAIRQRLGKYLPDVLVCDSPLAVVASVGRRHTIIIYDVTEWYPSKKNLAGLSGVGRWAKAAALLALNAYAAWRTDRFVFGERGKARPFRWMRWKQMLDVPYYPDLRYIRQYPLRDFVQGVDLLYSGPFNDDKGAFNVLRAASVLACSKPGLQVNLRLICAAGSEADEQRYGRWLAEAPANLHMSRTGYLPFEEYCHAVGDCHFFLDLRRIDAENTRCLPIKLFYYLACGRPVVYSDLKAIRKGVQPFDFGCLARPDDAEGICRFLLDCIDHPDRYREYAAKARRAAEKQYNWGVLEEKFVEFVMS